MLKINKQKGKMTITWLEMSYAFVIIFEGSFIVIFGPKLILY